MGASSESAFDAMRAAYRRATGRIPERAVRLAVAKRRLELGIAGPELAAAILRSLGAAHVTGSVKAGGPPALRVSIWSGDEAGIAPPLRRIRDDAERRGDLKTGLRASSRDGRFFRYQRGEGILWLDRDRREAVGCFSSPTRLNQYERGRPLHPILVPWAERERCWILHAGIIGADGWGALLPGAASSGKTTTTLASVVAGLSWAGDDVALVTGDPGRGWFGHGIYSSAKLDPGQLEPLPELAPAAEPGRAADEPKSLVMVEEALPGRWTPMLELTVLLFPRLAPGEPWLEEISPGEALRELIRSTIHVTRPRERLKLFSVLSELASSLPAHRLFTGSDPRATAKLVKSLASKRTPGYDTRR